MLPAGVGVCLCPLIDSDDEPTINCPQPYSAGTTYIELRCYHNHCSLGLETCMARDIWLYTTLGVNISEPYEDPFRDLWVARTR